MVGLEHELVICSKGSPMRKLESALTSSLFIAVAAAVGGSACGSHPPVGGGTGGTGGSPAVCRTNVRQGALAGKAEGTTCEYLGVPFGAPPVGELRFAPPKPAASWSGVRDATAFGASCIQKPPALLPEGVTESEDCLFLNVYTPQKAPARRLPVMVFIHGGAGIQGTGAQYGGQDLSERGPAVVVTLNYRLGPFGFLALSELDAQRPGAPSGTDAVRDQQLALRWVKDNIARFNGDPNDVTLFGESAGGVSTCIQLVSPASRGLAQRFILESGTCVSPPGVVYTRERALHIGTLLAEGLCAGQEPVACLRAADAETLATWTPSDPSLTQLGASFGVTVDGPDGVLPDLPKNLVQSGNYDRTAPIIVGTNKREWGLLDSYTPIPSLAYLSIAIDTTYGEFAPQVKALYPAASDAEAQGAFDDLFTDLLFRCPARDFARGVAAHGSKLFMYSYEVGRGYHTDELLALFSVAGFGPGATVPSPEFRSTMQGYWTSFASSGTPRVSGSLAWPQYDAETEKYLVLAEPALGTGEHLQRAQCDFWSAHDYFLTQ
jgi:para-nitrobenzyl esterase